MVCSKLILVKDSFLIKWSSRIYVKILSFLSVKGYDMIWHKCANDTPVNRTALQSSAIHPWLGWFLLLAVSWNSNSNSKLVLELSQISYTTGPTVVEAGDGGCLARAAVARGVCAGLFPEPTLVPALEQRQFRPPTPNVRHERHWTDYFRQCLTAIQLDINEVAKDFSRWLAK